MRRICLIVDHPERDLDGLVLLSRELALRGEEVFLVPMYRRQEVFLLRPDLVLVNYARYASAPFMRACSRLGILVGVLDTEGGVLQDVDRFADKVADYLEHVDVYCTWGHIQADALERKKANGRPVFRATGCPRYDFSAAPWREAIPEVDVPQGPMVLVNTNFPIVNPRFQSPEEEVADLVERMKFDETWVRDLVQQARHAREEVQKATLDLAERFPSVTFVIRPHPFEKAATYVEAARGLGNVRVIQTGSVFEWIKRSAVVLHHHCSTAVESVMLDREAILLDWIDTPLLVQPASESVSHKATSVDALAQLVGSILQGNRLAIPEDVAESRERVIRSYFLSADGESARRVADFLTETLDGSVPRGASAGSARRIGVVQAESTVLKKLQAAILLIAGPSASDSLLRLIGGRRFNPAKAFTSERVQSTLDRLMAAAGGEAVQAEPTRRAHLRFKTPGRMRSVRVAAERGRG